MKLGLLRYCNYYEVVVRKRVQLTRCICLV